jgi:hypothetical protein
MNVDFPQPDSPAIQKISFLFIEKSMFSSALITLIPFFAFIL